LFSGEALVFASFLTRLSLYCLENFSSVNPDFNADFAVSGVCFCETIVDVSTQCLQRNGSFMVMLASSDFSSAQTAGNLNFDTLCTQLHGTADALFHCTTERDTSLQLRSDVLSNQLCVFIWLFNFNNVNKYLNRYLFIFVDDLFALCAQLFDLSSAFTDNHTWFCTVDVDSYFGCVTLDLDAWYACQLQ